MGFLIFGAAFFQWMVFRHAGRRRSWPAVAVTLALQALSASETAPRYDDIESPPHRYSATTPKDRVSQLKEAIESGRLPLDRSSEAAFLSGLLRALDIPASSQTWVFSTTSLQLSFISPSNPRAIYFNENVYVGYIPGGRIELVAIDPDLGAIFYIFDIPRGGQSIRFDRSDRCMNCHASDETGHVPGILLKSVTPAPTGGSLTAYRIGETGHHIPLSERFGGWHLTGIHGLTNHWGNMIGRMSQGVLNRISNPPGERFNKNRYLVETSDILAHLLLEHQAGFINRAVEAGYRTRTAIHQNRDGLTAAQEKELDEQAGLLTRYLLFADEAALPGGGIEGDPVLVKDFLSKRKPDSGDDSLRDLDLKTRLFKHRCSYMIYETAFAGLPEIMKRRVSGRMSAALDEQRPDPAFAYLEPKEKRAIQSIVRATLPGFLK